MNKNKKTLINDELETVYSNRLSYFDTIQTGPLEEEIIHEFYFDTERFKEYLKEKELNQLLSKKFKE